ncbi:MAG: class I SAM-dependent methyltransferase [Xenococcaceae cyanobacterium MO_188.B19]|nr:class I SAM-dependent methyltransferase [Xenococcaceae cyanobacterium MO_188.B19]
MTSTTEFHDFQRYFPVVGNLNSKSGLAYKLTRGVTAITKASQMALAESYIHGLEIPDSLVRGIVNTVLPIFYKYFPSLLVPYEWVLKESDKLAESSQELMKLQYDLPEELFTLMLKENELIYPKYTMALWERGASDILEAQKDMLNDVIEKVGIKDGDNILDLGCGFGASCNYILSQFPNVKVTGLNLSHIQCEYMRKKMQDPGSLLSSDRFTLIEQDFNETNFETKFDKVIAIGLLEHIGNLTKALEKIASFLQDNGRVFIHIISIQLPHNMYDPFINKYIFPRARIWHYNQIPLRNQKLKTVNQWYMNGSNYAQTLRSWLKDFDANQDKIKTLNYGMDYGQFRRMWRLYLLLCIAYFEACNGEVLGNGQYLLVPN